MIVYDTECIRPPIIVNKLKKYEYASGWDDYKGMGIAVLVVYDYMSNKEDEYYVFVESDFVLSDRINAIRSLFMGTNLIVGFNNKKYDNNLIRAHGIPIKDENSYDILEQLWFASGLSKNFDNVTHGGFSMDKVVQVNFDGEHKIMSGKDAPFLWQDGRYKEVIEYCKHDVKLTVMLLNKIFETGGLISPKTKKLVKMPFPGGN